MGHAPSWGGFTWKLQSDWTEGDPETGAGAPQGREKGAERGRGGRAAAAGWRPGPDGPGEEEPVPPCRLSLSPR